MLSFEIILMFRLKALKSVDIPLERKTKTGKGVSNESFVFKFSAKYKKSYRFCRRVSSTSLGRVTQTFGLFCIMC